ncbi:MAG: trypsin-like peptidase domain-containing protein [Sedimentisphaerales bacterium]|nr:trypsin-like peptidase domain-containing protein [Sedimentisphaerales bacterium]
MMKKLLIIGLLVILIQLSVREPVMAEGSYSRRTPIVEAYEKNKDAVVSISSKYITEVRVENPFWFWSGDDWPFSRRRMEIPSLGSGFIINELGYIVTNAHVVERADEITVVMSDGRKFDARKVVVKDSVDLALLKIDADKSLPTVTLGECSDDLYIGETVLAIGNPFGYQQTLTDGILSAIHRDVELGEGVIMPEMLQISAPINPGNSGGPLLNINGEVIGINTAIRRAAQGIGFAISIDRLTENLPEMLSNDIEFKKRINLGMQVTNITSQMKMMGVKGLLVQSVRAGTAADAAGFQTGDVITTVDGVVINSAINFYLNLLDRHLGATLVFNVLRGNGTDTLMSDGKQQKIELTLRQRPKPDGIELASKLFGLEVVALTESMIQRYNVYANPGNVMVKKVEKDSPAYHAGIEIGDIIMKINDSEISGIEQLGLKLEMLESQAMVKMIMNRIQKSRGYLYIRSYDIILRTRSSAFEGSQNNNSLDL